MRNLKSIVGIIVGVSIVFGFAGMIHGANLWFSHALYVRDVEATVRQLERELYFALSRDAGSKAQTETLPFDSAETNGASAVEQWHVRGTSAPRQTSTQAESVMQRIMAFAQDLEARRDITAHGVIWFDTAGYSAHGGIGEMIPLTQAPMNPLLAANIEGPLRQARATGSGTFALPHSLGSDLPFDNTAVIALPVSSTSGAIGAVIATLDLTSTISFMNDFVQGGVAIVIVLCVVAMLIATVFVWMRFRDRLKASKTIQFLAHHDALTGLPNRTVFATKLNEALRLAHAKATNVAVMLIDVDKFKQINDTHGHAVGDLFLQVISDRLRAVFGDHLVARLSGDEFAVLITSVTERRDITRLAATMIEATRAPTRIDGKDLQISLSIGIAQAREAAWRTSRILHCADLALYRSKHSGRSTFKWYAPEMDEEAQRRKELEGDLRKALEHDEFRLLYQPQFSLQDQKLTGYETLLRWHHPEKGTISPSVFIPIAEDSGLIEEIGAWVLNRACAEAAAWDHAGLCVAVNVSPAQFRAGMTEKRVAQALEASGLDPARLEIEITESLLISDTDAVVKTLMEVRRMGVSVAMDDFGTGYSSLSYLSRFPFDTIKIDRTFVATLGKNRTTDAVVASIIGLGRSLDVTITAEGVENEEQVMMLRAAGCHKVQGFLFGRPMDLAEGPARTTIDITPKLPIRDRSPALPPKDAAVSDISTPMAAAPSVETSTIEPPTIEMPLAEPMDDGLGTLAEAVSEDAFDDMADDATDSQMPILAAMGD